MSNLLSLFKKDSIEKRIEKIKTGDEDEREKLIEDYLPFIIKTVSSTTNRYIELENSEEYCIGLAAFNEAINKYKFSKGNFISFAKVVIQSRTKDFLRSSSKHCIVTPISQLKDEKIHKLQEELSVGDFTESVSLKSEIEEFEVRLKLFNITFNDLVKECPRHTKTRLNAISIAKYIYENKELKNELVNKKRLPNSKIIKELDITAKILNRSRKFIIATVLILDSDLNMIKGYISQMQGGE